MWCPGCNDAHRITNLWGFDGNVDNPTFDPSILVNGMSHSKPKMRCHSYVRNGKWEFLSDCDHALAGLTVDMVDLPKWLI